MTTNLPQTPYDAQIARFNALVNEANLNGTPGSIWDNEHRIVLAKEEGYLRALQDVQPLRGIKII